MTLAALAPSRASTVRIRPTETARCRLDAFTHRRNPRPHRGGGHLRGWRTIPLASVRADAAERTADGGRDRRTIPIASIRADAAARTAVDPAAGAPPRSFDPSTLDVRHFINLKNGVEAIPTLRAVGIDDYAFVRIQSTLCEVGDMEKMLLELDANLLVSLALGYSCVVYDYGSRDKKRGVPRSLWYGLEFTRFALNRYWFAGTGEPAEAGSTNHNHSPVLRGKRVDADFRRKLSSLSKSAKKRIKYYRKFVPQEVLDTYPGVRLVGAYAATDKDDDEGFYAETLRGWCAPTTAVSTTAVSTTAASTAVTTAVSTMAKVSPPRTEAEVAAALEGMGLSMFYGGEHDEEWTNRWVHHREATTAAAEA